MHIHREKMPHAQLVYLALVATKIKTPIAKKVKPWLAYPAVLCLWPDGDGNISNCEQPFITNLPSIWYDWNAFKKDEQKQDTNSFNFKGACTSIMRTAKTQLTLSVLTELLHTTFIYSCSYETEDGTI